MDQDDLKLTSWQAAALATLCLGLALASVGAVLSGATERAQKVTGDAATIQTFLTAGQTGARSWEVFPGREGAVCGCTQAPGEEVPRNFVMNYASAIVSIDDGSAQFAELWQTHCAATWRTTQEEIL